MTGNSALRLRNIAASECLPYLLELPILKPYLEHLSFILVGSAATGLCSQDSDVDIAIVCNPEIFEIISKETSWHLGRPTEEVINGTQLHYYGITFATIENKFRELEDNYLYIYGNAVILRDPEDRFAKQFSWLTEQAVRTRKERIEGKLDMLRRRSRALQLHLTRKETLVCARVGVELITRCLKLVGLLDDVPFDPRKRLLATALEGRLGQQVKQNMRELLRALGSFSQMEDERDFGDMLFPAKLAEVTDILLAEAKSQGFQIALKSPDRRQMEE